MWRLLRPLRYFTLRNRAKTTMDVAGALAVALLVVLPFLLVPEASFFRTGGMLDRLIGLMSALTGFFVAALVAAATFAHADLDKVMTSGAVEMRVFDDDGQARWQKMTRRELACAIFGYLSFAGFVFSVAAAIVVSIASAAPAAPGFFSPAAKSFLTEYREYFRIAAMFCVAIPLGHIMTATALGIYYLMERLHYKKPIIVSMSDAA